MQLWRKMKKERKRIFDDYCTICRSNSMRFSYDANTYAQNFDHGLLMSNSADLDDISRSFSARFAAVPSTVRIFGKDGMEL